MYNDAAVKKEISDVSQKTLFLNFDFYAKKRVMNRTLLNFFFFLLAETRESYKGNYVG